ncbi:MAG TPA: tRNA lysidine(34) synthetase TilS [Roseiflexaceae bacterium]|nr:tRNA lysidine(34) synthetase TilS [Roseiflexaceae bacterium]
MSALVEHIRLFLRGAGLAAAGPLVVGVSGGPDSLCLLHALAALRVDGLRLHVAHLDHGLRGADGAEDAAFVARTAEGWGLAATVERADVAGFARGAGLNLHHAARVLRYRFLARVAVATGAAAVAVAHTADDQAETVLMHLLRGAGPAGLGGIRPLLPWNEWALGVAGTAREDAPPAAPPLLRPLLAITRADVESYCAAHELAPRQDATNADPAFTRNRIRHELLPLLKAYNSHVVEALGRTATICADEHAFVGQQFSELWPELAQEQPGVVRFDLARWGALHPALQRQALRRAYRQLAPDVTLPWEQVERARALVGRVDRRADLPGGITLSSDYTHTALTRAGAPLPTGPQLAEVQQMLPVPGSLALADGWSIHTVIGPRQGEVPPSRWHADLDAALAAQPLLVRRRRPGDRIDLGGGSKRLQDLFVDARVPRALRDAWPVVVAGDAVVWVAGLRAGARFRASAGTHQILRIYLSGPDVDNSETPER